MGRSSDGGMTRGGTRPRGPVVALYALGLVVAVAAVFLIRTVSVENSGLSRPADLTSLDALSLDGVPDQFGDTGVAVTPLGVGPIDTEATPTPVVTWSADGLPPGITISPTSGLVTGTPHAGGTFHVTVTARSDEDPPESGSTSFTWTVVDTAPVVSGVEPTSGASVGGGRVVLTGTGFGAATTVDFGGVTTSAFTSDKGGTRIVTTAPPEYDGTVDVTVTSAGGTSTAGTPDHYTYVTVEASRHRGRHAHPHTSGKS